VNKKNKGKEKEKQKGEERKGGKEISHKTYTRNWVKREEARRGTAQLERK